MRQTLMGAAVALCLVGCSGDGTEGPDSTGAPTAEQELQIWAGELCAATDQLQTEVAGVTESIDLDLAAGLDQLPQIVEQLEARVNGVSDGVQGVESVLENAPASSPEATIFAAQVQARVTSARASGEEAMTAAQQAVNAGNFLEAGVLAASAIAAAQAAYDDASKALELIDGVVKGEDPQLREAFAAAPQCR